MRIFPMHWLFLPRSAVVTAVLATLPFWGWIASAYAAPGMVTLVVSDDGGPYQEFASRFHSMVEGRGVQVTVLKASQWAAASQADVVIPVGVRATETVLRTGGSMPVLATLIPRSAYSHLKKGHGDREAVLSAIYLDQPYARQFALIRQALPERKRVGVLLGPESAEELRALRVVARESGLSLASERVATEDDLLPSLKMLLTESDVLLAVPDPLVYTRQTVQSILLTSYRAQDPLVAYSQPYVKAGALTGVYSTPAQIAQQAGELVLKLARSGAWVLPAPQYPKYFSVSVNEQVARSMGIDIADENSLRERLMAAEVRE